MFVADPAPLIPILGNLKDAPEEYVRRSVANNLNDIAKDHPDLIAQIATKWLKAANNNRKRLVKHACRTLIKQGHKPTLQAFGYTKPKQKIHSFETQTTRVELGNHLAFSTSI